MSQSSRTLFLSQSLVVLITICPLVLAQPSLDERLVQASPDVIAADAGLTAHMQEVAQTVITEHCAACHGADLGGKIGVPDLVDYDWNWGVTGYEMTQAEGVFEIMQTVLYGVRNQNCAEEIKRYGGCPDTRFSQMPAYSELGLTAEQLNGLVEYTLSLSGAEHDEAAVERVSNFTGLCAECHSDDGSGYKDFGGPDLTDDTWLFGSDRQQILDVISNGRTESCPAWNSTLSPVQVKAVALYIYQKSMGY